MSAKTFVVRTLLWLIDTASLETFAFVLVTLAAVAIVANVVQVVVVGRLVVSDGFVVQPTVIGALVTGIVFVGTLLLETLLLLVYTPFRLLLSIRPCVIVTVLALAVVTFALALFPTELLTGAIVVWRPVSNAVGPPVADLVSAAVSVVEPIYPLHSFYNVRLQATLVYPAIIDIVRCPLPATRTAVRALALAGSEYSTALETSVAVPDFTNATRALLGAAGASRTFLECTCASGGALVEPTITALTVDTNAADAVTGVITSPFALVNDGAELFTSFNFTFNRTFDAVLAVIENGLDAGDDVVRRNWDGVARTTINRADGVAWVDFVGGPPKLAALARGRLSRRFVWGKYVANIIGHAGETFTTYSGQRRLDLTDVADNGLLFAADGTENGLLFDAGLYEDTRWIARALRHLADDIEGACSTSAECNAECRPRQGFGRCNGVLGNTSIFCRDDAECPMVNATCNYAFGACSDGTVCSQSAPTCTGRGLCGVDGRCALATPTSVGSFENWPCTADVDCDVCFRPEARCTGTCTGSNSKIGTCTLYIAGGVIEGIGAGNLAYRRTIVTSSVLVVKLIMRTLYTQVTRAIEAANELVNPNGPGFCPNANREYCTVPRNGALVLDGAMYLAGHREETDVCPAAVCNLPRCSSDRECQQQGTANFSTTFVGQAPVCNVALGRCVYSPSACALDMGQVVDAGDCLVPRNGTNGRRCALRTCGSGGSCTGGPGVRTYAPDFSCACTCPTDDVRTLALEVSTGGIAVSDAIGHVFGDESALRCFVAAVVDGVAETADGAVDLVTQIPALVTTCPPGERLGRCGGNPAAVSTTFCSNSGNCTNGERCEFWLGTCSNGATCQVDSQCGLAGFCVAGTCGFTPGVNASLATPSIFNPRVNCTTNGDCDRCFRPSPVCRELDLDAREILRSSRSAGACFARGITELVLPNATKAAVNSTLALLAEALRKTFDVPATAAAEQAYTSTNFIHSLFGWATNGRRPAFRVFFVETLTNILRGSTNLPYAMATSYLNLAITSNGTAATKAYKNGYDLLIQTNLIVEEAPNIAEDFVATIEGLSSCLFKSFTVLGNIFRNFAAYVGNQPVPVPNPFAEFEDCQDFIFGFFIDLSCTILPGGCCTLQDISCALDDPFVPSLCNSTTDAECTEAGLFVCSTKQIVCLVFNCTAPVSCTAFPSPMMLSAATTTSAYMLPAVCDAFASPCVHEATFFESTAAVDDAIVPIIEFLRNETCTRTNSTTGACEPALNELSLLESAPRALADDAVPPAGCCWRNTSAPASAANVRPWSCAAAAFLRIDFVDVLLDRTCIVVEKRGCFAHVDDASLIDAVGANECCNAAVSAPAALCNVSSNFNAWERYADARAAATRIRARTNALYGFDDGVPTTIGADAPIVVPTPRVDVVVAALRARRGHAVLVRSCLATLAAVLEQQAAAEWPPALTDIAALASAPRAFCVRYLDIEATTTAVALETYTRTVLNASATPTMLAHLASADAGGHSIAYAVGVLVEAGLDTTRAFIDMASGRIDDIAPSSVLGLHIARRLEPLLGPIARTASRANLLRVAATVSSPAPGTAAARRLVTRLNAQLDAMPVEPLVDAARAYFASSDSVFWVNTATPPTDAAPRAYGRKVPSGLSMSVGHALELASSRLRARVAPVPRVFGIDTLAEDACGIRDSPFVCCPTQVACANCSVIDRVLFAAGDSAAILADFHARVRPVYTACATIGFDTDYGRMAEEPCAPSVCGSRVCLADAECEPGVACVERVSRCNSSALTDTCTCVDTYRTRHRLVPSLFTRLRDIERVPDVINVSYLIDVATEGALVGVSGGGAFTGSVRARLTPDVVDALVRAETSIPGGTVATAALTDTAESIVNTLVSYTDASLGALVRLADRLLVCDVRTGLTCPLAADGARVSCSSFDDVRERGGVGLVGGLLWALLVVAVPLAFLREVPLVGLPASFFVWTLWTAIAMPIIFMFAYGGALGCYSTLPAVVSRFAVVVFVGIVRLLVAGVLIAVAALPCVDATPVRRLRTTIKDGLTRVSRVLVALTFLPAVPLCFWRDIESFVREFFACVPVPPGAVSLERTPLATLTASCYDTSVLPPAFIELADVDVGASSMARVHDVFFYWLERWCPGINEMLLADTGGATSFAVYYAAHTSDAHASADPVLLEGYASLYAGRVLISIFIFATAAFTIAYSVAVVSLLSRVAFTSIATSVNTLLVAERARKN